MTKINYRDWYRTENGKTGLFILPEDCFDQVNSWGEYPKEFNALNYATQKGGWLDTVGKKKDCLVFGFFIPEMVGFSLLDKCSSHRAELYVAMRPDSINRGLGHKVVLETVKKGFDLGIETIFLKVRQNHQVGKHLYSKLGFKKVDEIEKITNGLLVKYDLMELSLDS